MSHVESGEVSDATAAFGQYVYEQTERLESLDNLMNEALPILDKFDEPGGTNNRLIEVGRTDLVIVEPAQMLAISKPSEVAEKCNNFLPNFRMASGTRETGELDMRDQPKLEAIPPTREEVLALQDLPKLDDYDEAKAIEESGQYKAFGSIFSHARKPAFIRMLNLFPDFTADLVTRMSAPEEKYRFDRFEPELFVAYQLMSRLVDTSDANVIREDSDEADDWYLCR